jgi:hypothetical protein
LDVGYDVYDMVGWDALSIARTLGRYLPFAILVLLELALLIRARETAADRWAATASCGASWPGLLVAAAQSARPSPIAPPDCPSPREVCASMPRTHSSSAPSPRF